MDASIAGFDWDEGNRAKCLKHGVSIEEIESLFQQAIMILPDESHSMTEVRFRGIARSAAGRHVFLIFMLREKRGHNYIRPISARYMHRKEVEHYEKENPDIQDG